MRMALAGTIAAALSLSGCGDNARLPVAAGTGPDPVLPVAAPTRIPTVSIAPARGWPEGATPIAAPGLGVTRFAGGLDHPRWLEVLPNGDVLVAETNAPAKPARDLRGFVMDRIMAVAGAEVPSADRITLLRDADGDGAAEVRSAFLTGLASPFGMALVGDDLYVANTDALVRFPYADGQTRITAPPVRVAALPAGAINHHWTKGLVAAPGGGALYVSVGSNSDHGENGMEAERGRAAVWRIDPASGTREVFASGLRNPVGLDFEPATGALWAVVNERDELGGDLVPDYLTRVGAGDFFGWPYFYYGDHPDPRVPPPPDELAARSQSPDYALGSHVAPLGLAFAEDARLGARFRHGAFIAEHGSWNRRPKSGYRVIFVPFRDGAPAGPPLVVLDGFLGPGGEARGRPVGVALDRAGGLLVADDVGNSVWRVTTGP
jgi:glucose/arabinose dehydrogenase